MPHSLFSSRRGQPWQWGNWLVGIVTACWPVWPCLGTACGNTEQLRHSQQQPLALGQCQDLQLLHSTRLFVLHFDTSHNCSFEGQCVFFGCFFVIVLIICLFGFPPRNMAVDGLMTVNCPLGMNVCVYGVMRWIGVLSRVYAQRSQDRFRIHHDPDQEVTED